MLRDKFRLPKETAELLYSIVTAVAIPLIVVFSAAVIAANTRHDFDLQQKRQTELTSSVITQAIHDNIDKRSILQQQIEAYGASNAEITELKVIRPQADAKKYIVVGSMHKDDVAKVVYDVDYDLLFAGKQTLSRLVKNDSERSWQVLSPIIVKDKVIAIAALNLSLQRSDKLMSDTLVKSLMIGGSAVTIIVLLLINDVLFLEHALMPRKARQEDTLKVSNEDTDSETLN